MASDSGAGHYFEFLICPRLELNTFPFPVSKAKLLGDFYNNMRSAANLCPRFAYSFVSFMLRQYYWRCDSYSASRRSAANKKKSVKTFNWRCKFAALRLLARQGRAALPLSEVCNVALITFLYSANTLGATSLVALRLFVQNSHINWAVLTGNGNMLSVPYRHRGGRIKKINAWYLNTHMVYL